MPPRSSTNLLDPAAADSNFSSSPRHPACLPHFMADPCILSTTSVINDDSSLATSKRWIIVSHHLPIRVTPDPATPFGWSSYDPGTLVLQLHSGLPTGAEVLHVGTLCSLPTTSTLPTMMSSSPTYIMSSAASQSSSPPRPSCPLLPRLL